ncbi:aminotransferase class IV [Nocardioides insulae]|uniref:aminotransferase class IV n=1 Tax=Nocardioides insulae TaxID=394734 RepID=UPI000415CAD5|nr:aminotransferase class IV [Nocardioides insulae]
MHTWIDGRLVDPTAPSVALLDHGITVGDGVFESVKVVDGAPFALDRHLARLQVSAAGLGLTGVDDADLRKGVAEVLAAQRLALGKLRITVTAGHGPLGSGRGEASPTLIVAAEGMNPTPTETGAITVSWARNEKGALAGLKTTSYAENVIALAEAQRQGATEAVFPNTQGQLCEGTGSNVFYVVDGRLRTPTLASGCLAGVTRALVLEWYGGEEVDAPIEVVEEASEIFLVSTTRDVQAVTRWNQRALPVGPITEEVQEVWRRREAELVGR